MNWLTRSGLARCGRIAGWVTVLGLVAASCGCGPMALTSEWRRVGITPDGSAVDWGGDLIYIQKLNADVGVVNDDSTLYICLILRDRRAQRQMDAAGLDVWFEPQGDRSARIGVRFPIGAGAMMPGGRQPGMHRGRGAPEMAEPTPRFRTDEIEILGDSTTGPLRLGDVPGIRVAIARSPSRALVYELAMPLARSTEHPYAIGARPGDVVDVRLEIPTSSRPRPEGMGADGGDGSGDAPPGPRDPGSGGGPPDGGDMGGPGGGDAGGRGGGRGGRGGMGGPGGPGGMGGRPGATSEPWHAKARVTLARPA